MEFFDFPKIQPAGTPVRTEELEPDQDQDMRQSDSESLYRYKSSLLQSPNITSNQLAAIYATSSPL